jgi:hypothetical protein
MTIASAVLENPIIQILFLLVIFTFVGVIAYWIRRKFWKLPWENKQVDPSKALKEELERILVPIEEPLRPVNQEKTLSPSTPTLKKKNGKPSRKQAK